MTQNDDAELERLINKYENLIVSQAINFRPKTKSDLEDYIQEAKIAFVKGYHKFNPDIGVDFSVYIKKCIRNAILNLLRKKRIKTVTLSLEPSYTEKIKMYEILPDNLTELELDIVSMELGGYTNREIADKLSMNISDVKSAMKAAHRKILEANEETYPID